MIVSHGKSEIPVFQLKTSIENAPLLEQIVSTLEIPKKVYRYTRNNQSYALLLIRDRYTIEKKLIPILDNRLEGVKRVRYEKWKSNISELKQKWIYRNIKSTVYQQDTEKEISKPNKQKRLGS